MTLRTEYLRLSLRTPLVAAASPLSRKIGDIRRLEDAGISAVVLFSLFEEQLTLTSSELHRFLTAGGSYAETLAQMADTTALNLGPLEYLDHVQRAKKAVDIPIIASMNGEPHLRWVEYARLVEEAGADAIELNLYFVPTDLERTGAEVEAAYLSTIEAIRAEVKIPIGVKLSPFFTNMANMARRIERTGVDGLVLFNRFYQPDIDLSRMEVRPRLLLSTPPELRLPLRWMAILFGRLKLDLAASGGVHSGEDVVKMLLAGASVVELCSTLLTHGVEHVRTIEQAMRSWMAAHEFGSIAELRGLLSQARCDDPEAFERAQYIKTLETWDLPHVT